MDAEGARITPGYFATLKIPLIAGRPLAETDDASHPQVAVVNEALAVRFFGSPQNAIGRMMASGAGNKIKYNIQIVGVAELHPPQCSREREDCDVPRCDGGPNPAGCTTTSGRGARRRRRCR